MDRRLQEVCRSGDLVALHDLLEEDFLVLDRAAASSRAVDGPLHVAALFGHAALVREIVTLKPELTHKRNAQGSYPLHLASATGHRLVVEELLKGDAHLCLLRDGHGHLPIHTAVVNGGLEITGVLVRSNRECVRALTGRGESVLHLAVKSNNLEIVRLLVESPGIAEDKEFLNLKDHGGNTFLHLATARRQIEMLKFITSKQGVDVNATNARGATPLDVLLELPSEHGDLVLGDILFAAGGRSTNHRSSEPRRDHGSNNRSPAEPLNEMNQRKRRPKRSSKKSDEWVSYTPNTLMVVAVLIATVTFEAGIQPPGGFWQETKFANLSTSGIPENNSPHIAGEAVLASISNYYTKFMVFDMAALFLSTSIILLLLCALPHRKRKLTTVLVWVMWIAVVCTVLAFTHAIWAINPDANVMLTNYSLAWGAILGIAVMWMLVRFFVYLFKKLRR